MDWAILLSHHGDDERSRCVTVGGVALCRRCLSLYPAAFAALILQLTTGIVPPAAQIPLMALAPLPVTVAFILEQLGRIPYSPRWVVVGSLLMAPALGVGLSRYLFHPGDRAFWGMVLLYGTPALAALLHRKLSPGDGPTRSPS